METQNLFNTNNKDFQCPICQKYFSRKFTLDMHLLIHKGIKPHPCPFCGKCFRQRGTLMRHKALHSTNNLFFCNLCNRGFRQKNVFLHHLKHRHNVSTETLDRRKNRTQLKDYDSIMDTLPSFVLANSTAISTSEKDLDAMLLEAMNGIACESSSKLDCQTTTRGTDNHNSDNAFNSPRVKNSNFLVDKSDESIQELRYECELCCVQFLDFTSYRLHVEEDHNNDINLLDQKPFLFSVMSTSESVYVSDMHIPPEKENVPSIENLSSVYQDNSTNISSSVEKPNRVEDNELECSLCHEFFMSEEDFGRHVESHMQKILIENINMQENNIAVSAQIPASSNLKGDVNSRSLEISSKAKSLPDQAKLATSKDLISESVPNESVSLPATSVPELVPNEDSKTVRSDSKHFKCLICKCYCSNDISLKNHVDKHNLQKMLRIKKRNLKKNNLRAASFNEKCEHLNKLKRSFSSGFKVNISPNHRKVCICSICDKTFKEVGSLEYHKQMHLPTRSFHCGRCKQRFSDKQSLLLHTRSTHLTTFKCSSCSRAFSYRKLYEFHIKKCLKSEILQGLRANIDFPLVNIKELLKSNVEGLVGVIPICDKKNSTENFKIGIPILTVQHVKNITQLPLLSFS